MPNDVVIYENLRDEFLFCRTVLHAWSEYIDESLTKPEQSGWWWQSLQCIRCHTKRIDLIDDYGDVFSRRYIYPDGYRLDEKATRSQMRNEWAQRHLLDGRISHSKKSNRRIKK